MSFFSVLSFDRSTEIDDAEVTARIDALVDREFPQIKGWTRTVTKGGMLSSGNVSYARETSDFSGSIVVFLNVDKTFGHNIRVGYDVTAVLAEKLIGDDRYYSFDGSFLNGLGSVINARCALKRLADERRAMAKDFV